MQAVEHAGNLLSGSLPATQDDFNWKDSIKTLEAIYGKLPDAQSAPVTCDAMARLAQIAVRSGHSELAHRLEQSLSLASGTTAEARYAFRALLRLCIDLLREESEDGMMPGLAELRRAFLDHRYDEAAAFEQAFADRDFAMFRSAAHNLKGSGAAYGFAELTEIGRELETAATNHDGVGIRRLLDRMNVFIGVLRQAAPAGEIGEKTYATGTPAICPFD